MNEESLIKRLRRRCPDALEALMDRYIPYVSTVVWNILRYNMSKEDAEEVVSDVFLAAWNQADELRAGKVKAWLCSVARNKAKNKLREMRVELPLEENFFEVPSGDTPATTVEIEDERRQVRRAIDYLSELDREVFLRHYYYAQTVTEISSSMGMNESTVKTKLRRGRIRLKELLTRWNV